MSPRYSVRRSVAALIAAAATAAGAMQAAPAAARTPAADTDPTGLVFVLRPADPAAAVALSADRTAGATERALLQRRAAPPAGTADRVAGWLRTHGLTVTGRSTWAVTATGDAALAGQLLGVRVVRAGGHVSHVGALRTPAGLAGDVRAVLGLDDRPVFRHRSPLPRPGGTLGGPELRAAYDASPAARGSGLAVATIQFSGWNKTDLTDYATAAGVSGADPAALSPSMDVTQRSYHRDGTTDGNGDFEVALDQESLLATAPGAAQRIYFALNTLAGFETALQRVLDDVATRAVPIAALSISWGACEPDMVARDQGDQLAAIEDTLEQLTAAGVTVFAASGDAGAFDCSPSLPDGTANPAAGHRAVDFPGSSPVVVSVGGTRLTHTASGWHEQAWGPLWASAGRHVGSGGGYSRLFGRPGWQAGIGGQFATAHRAVPDISSAADPQAGFGVYQKRLCGLTGWCLGGGTSAGAPAQAGLFVAALAAAGRTSGIGDVHGVLYGNPDAFRDIRSGSNGVFPASTGWDPATGLGSPLWGELGPRLLSLALVAPAAVRDPTVPVATSLPGGTGAGMWTAAEGPAVDCTGSGAAPTSIPLADAGDRATQVAVAALTSDYSCLRASHRVVVDTVAPTSYAHLTDAGTRAGYARISWGVSADGPAPSWAGDVRLQVRRYRDGAVVWSADAGRGGHRLLALPGGAAYRLEARTTDRAGNTGTWSVSPYAPVASDGNHLSYGANWRRVANRHALGRYIRVSSHRGAYATGQFTGTSLWLLAYTTPGSGTVDVDVDGRRVQTVNLYSAHYQWRHLLPAWHGTLGTHRFRITVTGWHARGSSGTRAWIDGFAAR